MFSYSNNDLYCEQVALADVAAKVGTPAYVYSSQAILANYRAYDVAFGALPHTVCYAVKANSSLAVLALLAKAGAGFDIVSGGELARVLAAGGDVSRVVFSGVGKTAAELVYALDNGIHSFNCESEPEIELLNSLAARRGMKAGFSIRVNPDVDAATHPYIATGLSQNKFGIAIERARAVYEHARTLEYLSAEGVSCHIGSQILDPSPLLEAVDMLLELALQLRAAGSLIRHLDLGGGLGIAYRPGEIAPPVAAFVEGLRERLADTGLTVMVEPGRSIVGPAGVLLTRVLYRKQNGAKEFIVVDAAMNDLIRPAFYDAYHEIVPLVRKGKSMLKSDVVGPICESGDYFCQDRPLSEAGEGDYLALMSAGAYGFVMASSYNTRPLAAEILVNGRRAAVARARQPVKEIWSGEKIVAWLR